jgi:hypothetical protein
VRSLLLVAAFAWLLAGAGSRAGEAPTAPEGFESTGQNRKCVPSYEIRETRVIDPRTILFRLGTSEYYVNRLPHDCPELKLESRFTYTLRGTNELCDIDTITVINSSGTGAGCLLGKFEELKKKP